MICERSQRLNPLFGGLPVVAYEVTGSPTAITLLAEEEPAVANAIPSRRNEFAAGRICARNALADLGFGRPAIPVGPNREPVWPVGVMGSISHTRNYCFAAACRAGSAVRGLGVDVEQLGRVGPDTFELLFGDSELRGIAAGDARGDPDSTATRLFSAKESFFKAQFPLTECWIGFRDVVGSIELATNDVILRVVHKELRGVFPLPVRARCLEFEGVVATAVTV